MSARRAVAVSILAIAVSACTTLQPPPPDALSRNPTAQAGDPSGGGDRPPHYAYRSPHCTSRRHSRRVWGLTSKGLAVVAGGMAAAGALPVAALIAGLSSAGMGIYADYQTADYVRTCTTGNGAGASDQATPDGTPGGTDKLPPLTFSGFLTVVAGMLSAI